jgi:hypothetical protein
MAWTSPRTWIPGEFVTASMLNTHLRDNLLWLFGLMPTAYPATLANVLNTVTETDVCHFTVPAAAWGDGDIIRVEIPCLAKQNSGSNRTATLKVNVGAGAQVSLKNGSAGGAGLFSNDVATEFKIVLTIWLRRVGADVWITSKEYQYITDNGNLFAANSPSLSMMAVDGVSTPADFTGANVVTLKITLDNASALYYIKPQIAKVLHLKG